MDKEELIKQREIGQQLMLVRIIHSENEKASRGLVSFIRRSEFAEWAQKSEKELESFLNDVALLDDFTICSDAAKEYVGMSSTDTYGFFMVTFRKHGYWYIASRLGVGEECNPYGEHMEELAEVNATRIIEEYPIAVTKGIQSESRFKEALSFYYDFYINRIMTVLNEGYDWDVVSEMLGEEMKFTEAVKEEINRRQTDV